MVFSSHQLDLVEHVCQDVVVIDHGRVVLEGELEHVRAASDRRYLTVGFRGTGCWTPAFEHARVLVAEPGRTRLELSGGVDLEALVELARSAGDVTRFSLEPPALSDLFHDGGGAMTIRLVAWREITERTRGRAFLISTLVLVAVVLGGVIVPGLQDQTTRLEVGITGATPAALDPGTARRRPR